MYMDFLLKTRSQGDEMGAKIQKPQTFDFGYG